MIIKKAIIAAAAVFALSASDVTDTFAAGGGQPLQAYFSNDGTIMKVFTSEKLDDDASLLIGNETFESEEVAWDVEVHTTFLIDNSTSMPWSLRDEIKSAIGDYVSSMPDTEQVKIAIFDTDTFYLADDFSSDKKFISYELQDVDFEGQASLVYDAVLKVSQQFDTSEDVFYRTVLITDGVDSIEGTSFDYMKSVISENSRYHVDVVQVSEDKGKKDVNLKGIGDLGSNTFMMFTGGSDFDSLKLDPVSMIKVELNNAVTTGELKGVTIKNGSSSISLGSILFPQVEIDEPEIIEPPTEEVTEAEEPTTMTEEVTEPETEAETEPEVVTTKARGQEKKEEFPLLLVIAIAVGVLFVVVVILVIVLLKKKKGRHCSISVQICKDDPRDHEGVGMDVWQFPINGEFRVGRILEPKSNDGTSLPKNHRAIFECATNEDISSIGRNAFSLSYNKKANQIIIKNVAKSAMFSVEAGGRTNNLRAGQTDIILKGTKILLGNYTTVIVHNFSVYSN